MNNNSGFLSEFWSRDPIMFYCTHMFRIPVLDLLNVVEPQLATKLFPSLSISLLQWNGCDQEIKYMQVDFSLWNNDTINNKET